ncbi:MAG: hypothetical protein HY402_06340 [Elusimicrobia bacterium]|nr:hypothetical protein [Elusimicrobiota bacterium]
MNFFRSLLIDSSFQLRFICILTFLCLAESLLVGPALSKIIAIAGNWENPAQMQDFFLYLILFLIATLSFNCLIGLFWSHQMIYPTRTLEKSIRALQEGRFPDDLPLQAPHGFENLIRSFNELSHTLQTLILRDRRFAKEASQILQGCLQNLPTAPESEILRKKIRQAESLLSIVNSHFDRESKGPEPNKGARAMTGGLEI